MLTFALVMACAPLPICVSALLGTEVLIALCLSVSV